MFSCIIWLILFWFDDKFISLSTKDKLVLLPIELRVIKILLIDVETLLCIVLIEFKLQKSDKLGNTKINTITL